MSGTRSRSAQSATSWQSGPKRRASGDCVSASPTTAHTPGTGFRSRTTTIPKARCRASGTTRTTLTKADGKGKWWDGLDPQKLYTGRNIVMPDGFTSIAAANQWHEANDRPWNEGVPTMDPAFAENWFLRCQDLVDTYHPDLVYFDDTELPLGQYGLDLVAHYYNSSVRRHGKVDVIVTAKDIKPEHVGSVTLDIERGKANGILAQPWQTDTCIGDWYYQRALFDTHKYKTPTFVIHSLIDIVSRNGNLLLSIPLRGDGTLDEDEHAFLTALASWMQVHGGANLRHPPLHRLRRRTARRCRRRYLQRKEAAALHHRRHSLRHQGRHPCTPSPSCGQRTASCTSRPSPGDLPLSRVLSSAWIWSAQAGSPSNRMAAACISPSPLTRPTPTPMPSPSMPDAALPQSGQRSTS
jgi:hypothetical protein